MRRWKVLRSVWILRKRVHTNTWWAFAWVAIIRPDFAKLSISRLCKYEGCGSAKEHPVFPMSDDERRQCFQRFCRWLMSTNETTRLRAMKECIPQLENTAGQLLALDGEITTFLAQSGGTPSSARRSKCKRDSTDPTTPSKQRRVSDGSSNAITLQPFPLASDDDDDEVEFVEGPSKPISPKISRRTSPAPVAGSSSLRKMPASASPTKVGDSNSKMDGVFVSRL
ncbi:hypothetical protein BT96DRAFT_949672 [Gymnopus androsaceus JB14]|uniref:Uncharacterized protein n=1 Tax=Gymnopus androsaceus JB14 TaxID=1447944 RepID=A0A6A4GJX4_9AGAR|nr:hypothetical protein BT96DRAFT_949672 [Gymnopus androsaceus JB14]